MGQLVIIDLLYTNEKQSLSGYYLLILYKYCDHYSISFNVNIETYAYKYILNVNNFDYNEMKNAYI